LGCNWWQHHFGNQIVTSRNPLIEPVMSKWTTIVVSLAVVASLLVAATLKRTRDLPADATTQDQPVPPVDTDDREIELFPTDRVLDVQITVAEADWDKIRFQTRNFFQVLQAERQFAPIPSPYVYVNAKVTIDGVEFPDVGLRKKGFIGSQNSSRPSLKIKINHVNTQAHASGLTNLTFNNNNQDVSLMSQTMGYAIYNAAGSPAPRCAYAKITVNGRHVGLYTHVERIHKPLLKRGFGNDTGTLYEGNVVDFYDGWEGSFEYKFDDPEADRRTREKMKQLIEVLKRPVPATTADNPSDADDLERDIGQLVDLDSFYTYWAVESLLGFWDGYTANANNFFIYHNPKTDRFHFIPWGADCQFEKHSKLPVDRKAPLSVKTKGLIAHKLYQIPKARTRYLKTLKHVIHSHWDEDQLLAETKRIETLVTPHIPPRQRATVKFDGIRKFIRNRRGDIESETADGMPLWAAIPKLPPLLKLPGQRDRKQDENNIFHAAKTGDIDAIKKFLDPPAKPAKPVDINAHNQSGITALSLAVLAGQTRTAEFLIKRGADVTRPNRDQNTALHGAAFLGRVELAKMLIQHGAKLNVKNNRKETPLDTCQAPWTRQLQGIVQFIAGLLQISVDLDAVQSDRPIIAKLLRKHGAKLASELAPELESELE